MPITTGINGIELLTLRQIQDIEAVLSSNVDASVADIVAALQARKAELLPPAFQMAKNPTPASACPWCGQPMRREPKGNKEAVWHCLACQYSQYIEKGA